MSRDGSPKHSESFQQSSESFQQSSTRSFQQSSTRVDSLEKNWSVLQWRWGKSCVSTCSVLRCECGADCGSMLQCVAVCCSLLQCVAWDKEPHFCGDLFNLHSVVVCCSVLQRVAARCSALQRVAARCSAL